MIDVMGDVLTYSPSLHQICQNSEEVSGYGRYFSILLLPNLFSKYLILFCCALPPAWTAKNALSFTIQL
jgi:hypothetical protein